MSSVPKDPNKYSDSLKILGALKMQEWKIREWKIGSRSQGWKMVESSQKSTSSVS